MLRLIGSALAIASVSFASPALACSPALVLFQLPGETEEDARERSDKIAEDGRVIQNYLRQSHALEHASVIYLARVISETPGQFTSGRMVESVTVRPMTALKGDLPGGDRTLTDESESGGCLDIGDGRGSLADEGDLLVVFEGLPITRIQPRGIDSFPTTAIILEEVVDKMREHGKELGR